VRIITGLGNIPADWPASAVSIGKFDGVHAGHRAVIAELNAIADAEGLTSVVATFDRHPLALLSPNDCPQALISTEQKLNLLGETGVGAALVLEFSAALAALTPENFIESVLVNGLHAKHVLVGRDFRFGVSASGDVRLIDDVKPDLARRVSSTWIRELLSAGDVLAATGLLGHVPTVRGEVVHGAARGRELGFPTANLSPDSEGLIPADGVYAGWLTDAGVRYPAAISVGNNPTFEGVAQKQVEAYVLDREIDLYDHVVEVSFVDRIRGMVAFTGIEPLIVQMRDDVERVRHLLP
jgi:riboflavin kinase/FMN adenylyltransferase